MTAWHSAAGGVGDVRGKELEITAWNSKSQPKTSTHLGIVIAH